ncbi:MAG: hypothetical protein KF865_02500 [Bdellovibrionaceae bacterium]|nr:hypothetical protein [Pseudobdellovibrionaceae bacterium]
MAYKSIVVVDDFLKNPDEIRREALAREWVEPDTANYPGRHLNAFFDVQPLIRRIERYLELPLVLETPETSAVFRLSTTAEKGKTWVHRDRNDYTAIIYLSPFSPVEEGTLFYRHAETGLERGWPYHLPAYVEAARRKGVSPEELARQLLGETFELDRWVRTDSIAFRYNRIAIFDCRRFHSQAGLFGHDAETGRLTLNLFLNIDQRRLDGGWLGP